MGYSDVVVVDNGSTDGTDQEADAAGARVVREPRRGYGYACAAGVAASPGAATLVFMDGDGSFLPADLPRLVAPIVAGEADLVLGARSTAAHDWATMPPHQRLGNRLVSSLIRLLYGLSLQDIGPYRAVRRSLLDRLDMREMTYGWPVEMVVKAARDGARVAEVFGGV